MPVTYNGIGTHYYGRKNVEVRPGTCRSCHRNVQLQSYDTRLWFVIVFIPIIPLGRKRIIDYCPSCRRHYVSDLAKWDTARQLEVSGAMETFRSNPTPENAIAVHQQMLGFHQIAEATEFQKTMVAQFSENAKIHAYLGSALEHIGRRDQSAESFRRALELRPDMPEARVGVARNAIRDGRLDDARKMLDFLEKPGAGQLYSLEPLEILAHAYQNRGQHEQALELFRRLMEELPKVAEHPNFRKAVLKSEKAVKRGTMLPKQKFSLKRLFQNPGGGSISPRRLLPLAIIGALVVLGFVIANEFIRHNRKVYVVNAYPVPATVTIAGGPAISNFRGISELHLSEGRYHATITGPVKQELDFDVRDSYFNRWFGDPVWLINVGGGALLELSVATYSANPQPPTVSFHVGKTFEQFPNVTHPFTPLPNSVEVSQGGSRTLVGLKIFDQEATDVFGYEVTKKSVTEGLNFAEAWLGAHPDDEIMFRSYAAVSARQKQTNRLEQFLRSGLTNRPVRITWHRVFQDMHDHTPEQRAQLVDQYDSLLRAEPANSALLYLRGRIETNRALARAQFSQALQNDPANAFAAFALGYDRMSAGDWKNARPSLARAVELNPNDPGFAHLFFLNRIALGEAALVETELDKKLARDPVDELAEFEMQTVLASQGKADKLAAATSQFAMACKSRYKTSGDSLATQVAYHALYATGDFEKLKAAATRDNTDAGRMTQAMALIEQGHPDDAVKLLPAEIDSDDVQVLSFALAIAYRQNRNETAAGQWQAKGIKSLQSGRQDDIEAANLLLRASPPSRVEAEDVTIAPELKAEILVLLGMEYPGSRAELMNFAKQLNVERSFPFYLVQRAAGGAP